MHLEGDRIGAEFIVRGLVQPGEEPTDEAETQLLLRRRNTALLADSFESAGFEVVIDDVILWPGGLRLYLDLVQSRPVRFVVLDPRLDVIARRDAGRDKHVFELWAAPRRRPAQVGGSAGAAVGHLRRRRRTDGADDPSPLGRCGGRELSRKRMIRSLNTAGPSDHTAVRRLRGSGRGLRRMATS